MSIAINLGNPGILKPGDSIIGTMVCRFDTDENIRGIQLKFQGRERTQWSVKSGKHSTTYRGEQKFISKTKICAEEGRYKAGVYKYEFIFVLPESEIPSSYQHHLGNIRYFLEAKVDRPFAFDYEDSIILHVVSPIDFNKMLNEVQLEPVSYPFEKFPSFCWVTSEPVNMHLTINKNAFVIGENIDGKLHVENMSDLRLEQIKVSLLSHLKFTTDKPGERRREEEKEIATLSDVGLGAHSENTYYFNLRVPEILIPNFSSCRYMQQRWILRTEVVLPTFHKDLKCDIDIKIGHVPVGSTGIIVDASVLSESSAPPADEASAPPVSYDPSAPPPSYTDVINEK